MATADYPADKLFLSTLLEEDVELLKERYPGATCFQLDFLDDMDIDKNNTYFSDKLPPRLLEAFKNNEEIVIYMNPPYKSVQAGSTAVGQHMINYGLGSCATDLLMHFFYRLMLIKEFYGLTNLTLGIFSSDTLIAKTKMKPLYDAFRQDFKFVDGMCFSAGDFSNTSESIDWLIVYTVWKAKEVKDIAVDRTPVLLQAKKRDGDNIETVGLKFIRPLEDIIFLKDWMKPKDVERYKLVPSFTWYNTAKETLDKIGENALGAVMSRHHGIDGTRRCAITNSTCPDATSITEENFWRVVASFAARRLYAMDTNPFNNCQYYAAPDVEIEGYDDWVVQCLPLFLFDNENYSCSYRNFECNGEYYNISNTFYPIDLDTARQAVTDEKIIEDMEKFPPKNQFILSVIRGNYSKLKGEAKELFDYCLRLMLMSLMGTTRKDLGYPNWLEAWDASWIQLRQTEGIWTEEVNQNYTYLMNKYKKAIEYGLFRFGFLLDYSDKGDK